MFSILKNECRIPVFGTRFHYMDRSCPIEVVVFDRRQQLGFFDPQFCRIGLHQSLMISAKEEVLKNVIRHELAHYLEYLQWGGADVLNLGHQKSYRDLCLSFGWGKEVYSAQMNIESENQQIVEDSKAEELVLRVKKLLALAESSNSHEAELATRKANQLITKYNLSFLSDAEIRNANRSPFGVLICMPVLHFQRYSQKYAAILQILNTFGVYAIRSSRQIEVTGPEASVEVAEYVANFLDRKLEELYNLTRKANPKMKGRSSKDSFFRGVQEGYLEKIKLDQQNDLMRRQNIETASEGNLALTMADQLDVYREQLDFYARRWVYPRLTNQKNRMRVDPFSAGLGREAGKDLRIAQAITGSNSQEGLFLK